MQEQKKNKIDWLLLVFMILFTNQAMFTIKLMALLVIYLFRADFKFNIFNGRLPKFFLLIILLSAINFVFFIRDFSSAHFVAFIVGNSVWVFALLSMHQIKLSIEQYGVKALHRTLKVFMIIHFLLCLGQLLNVMIITGTTDPYSQTMPFPYGMSTGDNIHGTFFGSSYYNLVLSSMLAIYFLFRRNFFYCLMACTCLILIFGNFGTIIFTGILVALFFTGLLNNITGRRNKILKNLAPPRFFGLYIIGIILYIILLYITVSPDNAKYVADKVEERIYAVELSGKDNYRAIIADQTIDPMAFERFNDNYLDDKLQSYTKQHGHYFSDANAQTSGTDGARAIEIRREMTRNYIQLLQGKSLAVIETIEYLKSSPRAFFLGAGTSRFSSLSAVKMAGLDSGTLFTNLPRYIAPEFAQNHLLIIEERLKSSFDLYSTANWPDSLYCQLFGEYGLIGAFLFVIFYIGFFLKKIKRLSYGFWIIAILIPFAHLSYIFDTMCIMPYFELLLLLDTDNEE